MYQDLAATSSDVDASLASIDADGHLENWRGLEMRGGLNGSYPWPSFSPDGSRIAYRAGGVNPKQTDIVLQEVASGQKRVIYQSADRHVACRYSNKEPKILCTLSGREEGPKTDLFFVDDNSAAVEPIASVTGSKGILHYPDDGRTFYFVDVGEKTLQVTRWDRDTRQETLVVPGPQGSSLELPSFDGRFLLRSVEGDSLSVRPISGGDWRTLVSGVNGLYSESETTHDGNWAFYSANDSQGKPGLFRVSTAGGVPQRAGDLPSVTFQGSFCLSADGRQILGVNENSTKYDLWVLENFVPAAKK